jgi:acyl-coenzyme A thioesterase PaaI-like protein
MQFIPAADGGVTATVECVPAFQGYTGPMHGGIISLMLGAAVTNCLFQRGVTALAARLNLRFLEPAHTGRNAVVSAKIIREAGKAYVLEGSFRQGERLIATVEAVFMRKAPAIADAGKGMR